MTLNLGFGTLVISFQRKQPHPSFCDCVRCNQALYGEIERLILAGQKMDGIKAYRARKGVPLRDAKTVVDQIHRALVADGRTTDPRYQ